MATNEQKKKKKNDIIDNDDNDDDDDGSCGCSVNKKKISSTIFFNHFECLSG